jgi:hypothetical protein
MTQIFRPGDIVIKIAPGGEIPQGAKVIVSETIDNPSNWFWCDYGKTKWKCRVTDFELEAIYESPLHKALEEK